MSEENKQSEHPAANAPQESGTPLPPPTPGTQPVVPSAPQQPAPQQSPPQQSPVQQPAPQQAPAQQQNAAQPQAQSDPQQASQPPEQPVQQPNQNQQRQTPQNQQQPTFRENGAFSFFATPSDPDDDPTPMSVGFKIGWFVLGLIGGMLGLFMAWLSTSTLSAKRRRQALIWTWAGFAVQAVAFFIIVLNGGTFPGMPTGGTAAQGGSATGTGSTSAFG